jgi:hypothetical protein
MYQFPAVLEPEANQFKATEQRGAVIRVVALSRLAERSLLWWRRNEKRQRGGSSSVCPGDQGGLLSPQGYKMKHLKKAFQGRKYWGEEIAIY